MLKRKLKTVDINLYFRTENLQNPQSHNQPNLCAGICSECCFVCFSFLALPYADMLGWPMAQAPLPECSPQEREGYPSRSPALGNFITGFPTGYLMALCQFTVILRQVSAATLSVWYTHIIIAVSKSNFALHSKQVLGIWFILLYEKTKFHEVLKA